MSAAHKPVQQRCYNSPKLRGLHGQPPEKQEKGRESVHREHRGRQWISAVVALVVCIGISQPIVAQIENLTPAQRQMLNSLPEAQRQEALRAMREAQAGGRSESPMSSLAEELSDASTDSDDEQRRAAESPGLRAGGDSRLVIDFAIPDTDPEVAERVDQDPALRGIVGLNYYELDGSGVLSLPGLSDVALDGLSAAQIELRLGAQPELKDFAITVSILESIDGRETSSAFGYDFFESADTGFSPVTSGPVPPDYVLGPGDNVRVQFFGNVNGIYEFEVTRDGILNLPELGPVTVAGLPFSEFRADLRRRVQEMLIGTQVSVTMGALRTIRIFVLGDTNRPGSYVVGSLATISSALYQSGGISRVGSLRDIQLKRAGAIVARLDLYDLLLNGDTSDDRRLQPGDVIFVPPVGPQVSVSGAVKRPAVYEANSQVTVADLIRLAGGLAADAFPRGSRIERIDADSGRTVLSLDTGAASAATSVMRDGDVLVVPRILPEFEGTVQLVGHVHRPGPYEWSDGMRLTDLIGSSLALKPGADADYVLVRREDRRDRRVSVVSASLTDALSVPGSGQNIRLMPRDTVYVFDLAYGRQRDIAPILKQLDLQSRFGKPAPVVSITGRVEAPGIYPMEDGMTVSNLLRAGGGLSEEAYSLRAELVRYQVVGDEYRETIVRDVDLSAVLRGDEQDDIQLVEHDNLRISALPEWDTQWTVSLEGEVKFPGDYRIRRGETLFEILERAGGLTDAAFPEGAIFLRQSLKEREQQQIEVLAKRLEGDIASMSLENLDTTGAQALTTGRELLAQLRSTEAVGRLVIDIKALARSVGNGAGLAGSMQLRDGDRLMVPKVAQEVTVIGETQQNTSHLYQPGLARDDYINMSGGLTRRADRKLIYVVRASGAVVAGSRSKWFGRNSTAEVLPGDTIVVPLETGRIRPLTLWTNVTQILYQAAIAVAAIDTFGN